MAPTALANATEAASKANRLERDSVAVAAAGTAVAGGETA
jgi:hypothetical protein